MQLKQAVKQDLVAHPEIDTTVPRQLVRDVGYAMLYTPTYDLGLHQGDRRAVVHPHTQRLCMRRPDSRGHGLGECRAVAEADPSLPHVDRALHAVGEGRQSAAVRQWRRCCRWPVLSTERGCRSAAQSTQRRRGRRSVESWTQRTLSARPQLAGLSALRPPRKSHCGRFVQLAMRTSRRTTIPCSLCPSAAGPCASTSFPTAWRANSSRCAKVTPEQLAAFDTKAEADAADAPHI